MTETARRQELMDFLERWINKHGYDSRLGLRDDDLAFSIAYDIVDLLDTKSKHFWHEKMMGTLDLDETNKVLKGDT
jgi:hypothetical protein